MKYRAMVDSARGEYNIIVMNHHARVVSRIGFVAQDMKDFQFEIYDAILNRATEINNNEAECILEAGRSLEASVVEAGDVIMHAAQEWMSELSIIEDEFVSPLLSEIEIIMSIMQTETFNIFGYYNPVTEIQEALILLIIESALYSLLFEIFVSEIYSDFILFGILTDAKNEELFPLLNAAFDDLRASGNIIRNSLANCNG
jgi:hypothetical protein